MLKGHAQLQSIESYAMPTLFVETITNSLLPLIPRVISAVRYYVVCIFTTVSFDHILTTQVNILFVIRRPAVQHSLHYKHVNTPCWADSEILVHRIVLNIVRVHVAFRLIGYKVRVTFSMIVMRVWYSSLSLLLPMSLPMMLHLFICMLLKLQLWLYKKHTRKQKTD